MTGLVIALIVLGALATAAVLVRGIIVMARGKDITGQQSNKLMSLRVLLQGITILFVIILIMMTRNGG